MPAKLIPLPTMPKSKRLAERARIVAKNFQNEEFGVSLMDFMLIEIYNQFKDQDDFYSEQLCARITEARAWLEFFQGDDNAEIDGDQTNSEDD